MSAQIVNEMTYTVWCAECPFSTEPTIDRALATRLADEHDSERHPPRVSAAYAKLFPQGPSSQE